MNIKLEVGRLIYITFGPSVDKIGFVLDIVDEKRILIDGPCGRQIINIKRIMLTNIKKEINRKINSREIHKIIKENDILKNWYKNKGKIILKRNFVKNLSDYDRFKYMIGKKHYSRLIHLNAIAS